jgi:hypothetical protein
LVFNQHSSKAHEVIALIKKTILIAPWRVFEPAGLRSYDHYTTHPFHFF